MEITECPHCSTRVVTLADGTCPACRENVHDEPQPKPRTEEQARRAAWGEFKQSLQETSCEEPLQALRHGEERFADLRKALHAEQAGEITVDRSAAARIREELIPLFQIAIDAGSGADSTDTTSSTDALVSRRQSWEQLADALEAGDAEALNRHVELWERTERQAVQAASDNQSPTQPSPAELVRNFQNALVTFTPRVFVTPGIVAVNVLVFVLMVASGADFFGPTAQTVKEWGANFGPLTMNGQWWRLVTNLFLHFGVVHLGINMWVLWDVGRLVERLVGNVGFLFLYLISGIAGSIASLASNPLVVSAGASGAVFGVVGALLGFLAIRKDSIPTVVLKQLRGSLTAFVIFNVLFGMTAVGIDNAAHIGGLVTGFVCGLVLSQPLTDETSQRRPRRNLALLGTGTIGLLLAAASLPQAPIDLDAEMLQFARIEEDVLESYDLHFRRARRGAISEVEMADLLERDILPRWGKAQASIDRVKGSPQANQQYFALLAEYMGARQESWELQVEALRHQDAELFAQSQQRWQAADALARRLSPQQPPN